MYNVTDPPEKSIPAIRPKKRLIEHAMGEE